MSLITRMLRQVAVYWPPADPDDFGQHQYGDPVELACRWEDVHEEFKDLDDIAKISKCKVYVGQDVEIGGVLWLGNLDDANEEEPHANDGAYTIQRVDKIPNLRVTEYLRIAML